MAFIAKIIMMLERSIGDGHSDFWRNYAPSCWWTYSGESTSRFSWRDRYIMDSELERWLLLQNELRGDQL